MKLSLQLVLAATALLPSLVAAVPSLQPRGRNSPDNTCGGHTGFRCGPANDGPCCSQHGWCGASSAYCGAGCQSAFGTCTGTTPPPPQQTETDFTCGPQNGNKTCRAGYCCSVNGWCGTTSDYCSAGKCLSSFGVCTGGNTTPPNPPTPVIETDFTCGPGNGNKTCREGYCCSQYGYCGVTEAYCGNGCQSGFGQCGVAPPAEPEVPEEPTPEEPEEPEPEEPEPEEPEPEEPEPEEPEPEEPTPTLPEEPEPTPTEIIPAEPDPEECTDFGVGADCGEDFFCCPGAVCNEFLVCDLPPAGPTET